MASEPAPKVEQQTPAEQVAAQDGDDVTSGINWDSEIQLVSSLAKLQELERKVRLSSLNIQSDFVQFNFAF